MENNSGKFQETVNRYCHIIGKNTHINRISSDGNIVYECLNKQFCEKNGGCKNERFFSDNCME